ncbi:unnamed protein product [Aphanomyces euteiches]
MCHEPSITSLGNEGRSKKRACLPSSGLVVLSRPTQLFKNNEIQWSKQQIRILVSGEEMKETHTSDSDFKTYDDNRAHSPMPSPSKEQGQWRRNGFVVGGFVLLVTAVAITMSVLYATKKTDSISTASSLQAGTVVMRTPVFKYKCDAVTQQCVYQNLTVAERQSFTPVMADGDMSLRVCEMTCGNGSLVPLPQTISSLKPGNTVAVNLASFTHSISGTDSASSTLAREMQSNFNELLQFKRKLAVGGVADVGSSVSVVGSVQSSSTYLGLETDESYKLTISGTTVTITAATIFGYRHGLASLLQLVDWCDITRGYRMVASISIQDKPAFKHRGIVIDTSRNFHSLETLKRLVRTMGLHKLNKLHWHLTDTSSFPIEIKFEPNFNLYGNYQSDMAYSQANVKELVAYAKAHGVQVTPEIDAPAHVGAGWQWGLDFGVGELTLCWANSPTVYHQCWEAPCGQLNPMNEKVYDLLDKIWGEMTDLFESDVYHLGGDEVFTQCWKNSTVVSDHVSNKTGDDEYFEIWAKFQERVQNNLWKRAPKKKIQLWTSDLTTDKFFKYLPKDKVIIQTWGPAVNNEPRMITDAGYQTVVSFQDFHYLDCGFNGIDRKDNGWCAPYKTWQMIYEQPLDFNVTANNARLVLGSELVMWTEVSGEAALDTRVWPRASAFAERAWTNPSTRWDKAMPRLTIQAYRIIETGVAADLLQPHWCRQHPGECPLIVW